MTNQECLKFIQKTFREAELILGVKTKINVINAEPAGKFTLFSAKFSQESEEKTFLVMNTGIFNSAKSILLHETMRNN